MPRWSPEYSVGREQGLQLVRCEIAVVVENVAAIVPRNLPASGQVRWLDDGANLRDRARKAERLQDRLRCVVPGPDCAVRIREMQLVQAEGLAEIGRGLLDFLALF